ncbi:MAG: WecB/TagA/CpsF family glycosyltransferase [Bacilli bacterium]|nr:WecB/TagA/CpsF family glycosyltransferase [Bacilli bacterium]
MKDNILGFDVVSSNYESLIHNIFIDINNDEKIFIVNINPFIIMNYCNKPDIIKKLNQEKYQIADGIGIVWASKFNKRLIKERITGIDFMIKMCEQAAKDCKKIFLCGAKPEVVKKAKKNLEIKYKNIKIVGTCSGYVSELEMIKAINKTNADIVFVALGSPKQEMFILNNKENLKYKVIMPVGGSFDVISGNIKRAPNLFIKTNTEWLYRIIKEPKRIIRNFSLIKFVFLIIFNKKKKENNYVN